MRSKNSSSTYTRTMSPPRVESASKMGSFGECIGLQPLYPRQEIRSLDISCSYSSSNINNNCDSSSSSSGSDSDSYDDSDQVRRNELLARGSFAESVQWKSPTRTIYPKSCLIPSSDELSDAISPPPSLLSYQHQPQLSFKRELHFNSTSGEQQRNYNNTGQYPLTSSPIKNTNCEGNPIQHDTEGVSSNNEWLQSSTDYYSNAHNNTLLPVVLEGDEAGASSPDLRHHKHKECETEVKEKIGIKTKTSNLCGSANGESLDTILTAHNFFHDNNERKSDNHHDGNDIENLKVDPATDTIGSDTCQTQSLSNHSLTSSDSNNHGLSPCPSPTTRQQILEEELESRLQVILALKDAVVMQNRKSKKAARLTRKTHCKLISCAKTNHKLTKQNQKLEEDMEAMKKDLRDMRQRMVEAEIYLMQERRRRVSGESAGMPIKDISLESSERDTYYSGNNYDHDENHDLASF